MESGAIGVRDEVTAENLLEQKKKNFADNPERFLDKQFLVVGTYFDVEQRCLLTAVNPTAPANDLARASLDINYFILKEVDRRVAAIESKSIKT